MFLKGQRDTKDLYNRLAINRMAAHGDAKNIEDQMKDWEWNS